MAYDEETARVAYEMYASRISMTWGVVARRLGYKSHFVAVNDAKRYAKQRGLPWPLCRHGGVSKHGEVGKRAYELRRDTPKLWKEIALEVGAASASSASAAARQYALSHTLTWPPNKQPED